jgi:hypothetical protein
VFGQAAAMRVHVSDGNFARDPRIVHFKRGIEIADFRVPGNLFFGHQRGDDGCTNKFGKGRELKNRIRVHGFVLAELAHAKPLRIGNCVLKHHRNRKTRHHVVLHCPLREFFKLLDGFVHLLFLHLGFSLRVRRNAHDKCRNQETDAVLPGQHWEC